MIMKLSQDVMTAVYIQMMLGVLTQKHVTLENTQYHVIIVVIMVVITIQIQMVMVWDMVLETYIAVKMFQMDGFQMMRMIILIVIQMWQMSVMFVMEIVLHVQAVLTQMHLIMIQMHQLMMEVVFTFHQILLTLKAHYRHFILSYLLKLMEVAQLREKIGLVCLMVMSVWDLFLGPENILRFQQWEMMGMIIQRDILELEMFHHLLYMMGLSRNIILRQLLKKLVLKITFLHIWILLMFIQIATMIQEVLHLSMNVVFVRKD